MEKVAVVRCKSYKQKKVDKAIKKALELIEFDVFRYKGKRILIKPNVLGFYEKNLDAIITNPSIVKALLKYFKNSKVNVGESSFYDTENNFKRAGYWKFKPIIFEEKKLVSINDKNAKILKKFYLPEIVKKADLVVNLPKLKTHSLTKMTGAIKNLYGTIPGGMKQVFHKKAQGDKNFSSLLVDIYQNIKPELNIMDTVIAMEGEGPSSGEPKKVGLILASKNAIALDIVSSRLMGFKEDEILAIKEAVERGLCCSDSEIELIGDIKGNIRKLPNLKFKKPTESKKSIIKSLLIKFVKENPIVVNKEICTKCKICEKKCPLKAISLKPYPLVNKKKCIRCFCCIEICPYHALHLKETFLRKVVRKIKERRKKTK